VSGSADRTLLVWDCQSGACIMELSGHASAVSCLATLRDPYVASGDSSGDVRIWDTQLGDCMLTLTTFPARALATLVNGHLAILSTDHVRVWDCERKEPSLVLRSSQARAPTCMLELQDGRLLVGYSDGSLQAWELGSGTSTLGLPNVYGASPVRCLALLKEGQVLSASEMAFRIWL
jgi:WD40 repeat protein